MKAVRSPPRSFPPSGDPYAAPVQLHGGGAGEERANSSPGRLLPCSRWQQHPAQLLWERCDNPAGPRGPWWMALWRERKDEDVSATCALSFLIPFCFSFLPGLAEILMGSLFCLHMATIIYALRVKARVPYLGHLMIISLLPHLLQEGLVSLLLHPGDLWRRRQHHEATSST